MNEILKAQHVNAKKIIVHCTAATLEMAQLLYANGLISDYEHTRKGRYGSVEVSLKYQGDKPVITAIRALPKDTYRKSEAVKLLAQDKRMLHILHVGALHGLATAQVAAENSVGGAHVYTISFSL